MIACFSFWLMSLSSATNISARLLPDAGGLLISRYCSPRRSQTRSCIARMPMWFDLVELPSWAYLTETDGMEIGSATLYAPFFVRLVVFFGSFACSAVTCIGSRQHALIM